MTLLITAKKKNENDRDEKVNKTFYIATLSYPFPTRPLSVFVSDGLIYQRVVGADMDQVQTVEPPAQAVVEPATPAVLIPKVNKKVQQRPMVVRLLTLEGTFVELPRLSGHRDMSADFKRARVAKAEALLIAANVKPTNAAIRALRIAAVDVNRYRTKKRKPSETIE